MNDIAGSSNSLNKSLAQRVADILETAILDGRYKPGERIFEQDIAKSLELSRSPVREAFYLLERKGILSLMPRKGAFVPKVTKKGINDLLDLRRALDGLAVRLAAEKASQEMLERIENIIKKQKNAAEKNDKIKFKQFGFEFHSFVYMASENTKLFRIWEEMSAEAVLYQITDISLPGSLENWPNEHMQILEVIKSRDGDSAQRLAEEHVEKLRIRLLSTKNYDDF